MREVRRLLHGFGSDDRTMLIFVLFSIEVSTALNPIDPHTCNTVGGVSQACACLEQIFREFRCHRYVHIVTLANTVADRRSILLTTPPIAV